mmetsp:Transcript_7403/g.16915  ORF Transcript_7403/g.16915 Transcript_7403/m.16915 type:complete len:202 (+) Transcript_7403:556-1161(+)
MPSLGMAPWSRQRPSYSLAQSSLLPLKPMWVTMFFISCLLRKPSLSRSEAWNTARMTPDRPEAPALRQACNSSFSRMFFSSSSEYRPARPLLMIWMNRAGFTPLLASAIIFWQTKRYSFAQSWGLPPNPAVRANVNISCSLSSLSESASHRWNTVRRMEALETGINDNVVVPPLVLPSSPPDMPVEPPRVRTMPCSSTSLQ